MASRASGVRVGTSAQKYTERPRIAYRGSVIFRWDERIAYKRVGICETLLRETGMDIQTADSRSHFDWRRLHALGLPAGSVRALLAVLIFVTTWGLLVVRPNQEVPDYLRDLLFIIMGHFFAARRKSGPAEEPGPPTPCLGSRWSSTAEAIPMDREIRSGLCQSASSRMRVVRAWVSDQTPFH
jgi:hypothetical protein